MRSQSTPFLHRTVLACTPCCAILAGVSRHSVISLASPYMRGQRNMIHPPQHRPTMHTSTALKSASMCSVPPKADAESKDTTGGKADEEEKPKPASERLQDAVRDSKVMATMACPLHMLRV